MKLNESFEETLNYAKEQIDEDEVQAQFSLQPELNISVIVKIENVDDSTIIVNFNTIGTDKQVEDKGKETFKIFSTISKILMEHVEEHDIEEIKILAASSKRANIFEKLFSRFGNDWQIERHFKKIKARYKPLFGA
jgi:outer membrane receptor for ferric coprogen and ferric-rhodotorulic acid